MLYKMLIPKDSTNLELNVGYPGAVASFCLFVINSRYLLPVLAPKWAQETKQKCWKWRNTVNSLIHSCITGVGSLLNLWLTPGLSVNLLGIYTTFSLLVNSVTVGYFIYDFLDLAVNNYKRRTLALLLHHALVAICFGLALITRRYQGYAMVSLLLEVNSIFLHIRQLFVIHGATKKELTYKITSYSNIGTFFIFRLLPLTWQIQWLAAHKDEIPRYVVILGFVTSSIIMVLNLALLLECVYKDFVKREKPSQKHSD